jgi:hypothetical protein
MSKIITKAIIKAVFDFPEDGSGGIKGGIREFKSAPFNAVVNALVTIEFERMLT